MPLSTVSAVLARIGLGKLARLEPREPPNRYQRQRAGELVHIDVKKLARIGRPEHRAHGDRPTRTRGIGWEYVHVCVDDATRLAYIEVLEDEKAVTATAFLRRAVAHYRGYGIRVESVMTDNGSCYRGVLHAIACRMLGLRHLRTRPYRPRTNGKAERFIRTMLGGWAYGAIYTASAERTRALPGWLNFYNHQRPHGSLSHQPPIRRLEALIRNNVPGSYNESSAPGYLPNSAMRRTATRMANTAAATPAPHPSPAPPAPATSCSPASYATGAWPTPATSRRSQHSPPPAEPERSTTVNETAERPTTRHSAHSPTGSSASSTAASDTTPPTTKASPGHTSAMLPLNSYSRGMSRQDS